MCYIADLLSIFCMFICEWLSDCLFVCLSHSLFANFFALMVSLSLLNSEREFKSETYGLKVPKDCLLIKLMWNVASIYQVNKGVKNNTVLQCFIFFLILPSLFYTFSWMARAISKIYANIFYNIFGYYYFLLHILHDSR